MPRLKMRPSTSSDEAKSEKRECGSWNGLKWEVGMRKWELTECGSGKKKIEGEKVGRSEWFEVGRLTHRRPIGRDYAAAKDAEFGKVKRSAQWT
jgi:hypothetical protein